MAILRPICVDGKRFHWEGNHGVAELSDLGIKYFGRVYDDACDEGVTVQGQWEEVVFVVYGADLNGNEVAGWHLKSVNWKTGRTDGRFKILIIND